MAPRGSILESPMPVSLSIKDVPDDLAARLRERAARHHRSLQRELLALVESAVSDASPKAREPEDTCTVAAARPGAPQEPVAGDELLAELDAVVAGSRWGSAPLLAREQLHDRALARELDFDCRETELRDARAAGTGKSGR